MGKILSFDYSKKIGVLVNQKKRGIFLENTFDFSTLEENEYIQQLEKLIKKYKTVISYEFSDFINQNVVIPPVKDKKTKEFLFKNKLGNNLEQNKEYKFISIPLKTEENGITYDLYAIPTEIFSKGLKLNTEIKKRIDKFFLSQLSLLGISNYLFDNKSIFHAYADNKSITITVSKGKDLKYTRTVPILEGLEEEQLTNLFYENISLTYQYVIQNKSKEIDLIIFSGELSKISNLAELTTQFIEKPIASIITNSVIKNCDKETFDKFLIPIGNIFVPEFYNLMPDEFIENKNFNKVLVSANFILILIIIFLGFIDFSKYQQFQQDILVLDQKYERVKKEIDNFRKEYKIPTDELDYYLRYFNTLSQLQQMDILNSFSDIKNLINQTEIKNLNIEEKDNSVQIQILAEKKFNNLKDFVNFKGKIKNEIQNLSQNWILQDNTIYLFDQLKIILRLSLSKNVGAG